MNKLDKKNGEAPLHALVKKERKDRVALVLALLVNSNADIHLKTSRGATPLQLAVEVRGIQRVYINGKYGPLARCSVLWVTIYMDWAWNFHTLEYLIHSYRFPDVYCQFC